MSASSLSSLKSFCTHGCISGLSPSIVSRVGSSAGGPAAAPADGVRLPLVEWNPRGASIVPCAAIRAHVPSEDNNFYPTPDNLGV
ncbi:hypothetical protein ACFPRL_02040 [Pseudoclavibacter helvolus]